MLGVGEDRTDLRRRTGGGPSACHVLSVYLRGGPRYLLGERMYEFEAPVTILIPEGTLDADRQEGRVEGIFALFRSPGLLEAAQEVPGAEVVVSFGAQKQSVPCLKEIPPADAAAIASALRDIASVRGTDITARLKRASLLLSAISDYCAAESRGRAGGIHRAAATLHDLIDEFAFENIPMARLYGRLDISAAHAETLFRKAFGTTPVAFRRQLRMRRARELLVSSQMNVSEAAYSVGFTDPLYFSRVFRRTYGVTPSSLIRDFSNVRK